MGRGSRQEFGPLLSGMMRDGYEWNSKIPVNLLDHTKFNMKPTEAERVHGAILVINLREAVDSSHQYWDELNQFKGNLLND